MGLYNVIRTQPIAFPSKPAVSPALKELISQMLCKDPALRVTLPQVMAHPWTTHSNNLPLHCRQVLQVHAPIMSKCPKNSLSGSLSESGWQGFFEGSDPEDSASVHAGASWRP